MPGPPSSRSSAPSSSGEPSLRRLGVGNSSAERPVRAQLVVALVAALTLAAVPLYLMRHPSATSHPEADASAKPVASASVSALASAAPAPPPPKPPERLKLSPPTRVRCGASLKGGSEGTLCDSLPVMEEVLAKAIRDNDSCASRIKQAGSINYVLTIDFVKKALHVFPGASGDYHGPQARRSTTCIERALPKPDWESVRHQYRYYTIAILATYTPEAQSAPSPGGQPRFD
ncbi:MAG: hypothetical protein QM756_16155 [Polyangiaceae bacterium]